MSRWAGSKSAEDGRKRSLSDTPSPAPSLNPIIEVSTEFGARSPIRPIAPITPFNRASQLGVGMPATSGRRSSVDANSRRPSVDMDALRKSASDSIEKQALFLEIARQRKLREDAETQLEQLRTKLKERDAQDLTKTAMHNQQMYSLTMERNAVRKQLEDLQQQKGEQRPAHSNGAPAVDMETMTREHDQLKEQLKMAIAELHKMKDQVLSSQSAARRASVAFAVPERSNNEKAPTNKVALVFTDVENSTAMWELDSRAMTLCLAQHNAIFRGAIPEFRGYEVKTEGDAFMIAFQDTLDAVTFALAVQQRLVDAEWPEEFEPLKVLAADTNDPATGRPLFRGLRVRMGVHTGVPICQLDPNTHRMDYFGRMVNKAARIAGQAQAGQILVSRAVLDDVEKGIEGRAVSAPLGTSTLKGITEQVEIIQLLPTALSARTFKPKAAAAAAAAEDSKFGDQATSKELVTLMNEHEDLKKKFAALEDRLQQIDSASNQFASKMDVLKETMADGSATEEDLSLVQRISREFQQLQRKQADTAHMVEEMTQQKSDLNDRVSRLSTQIAQNNEPDVADPDDMALLSLSDGAAPEKRPRVSDILKKYKALEVSLSRAASERDHLSAKVKQLEDDLDKASRSSSSSGPSRKQDTPGLKYAKDLLAARTAQLEGIKTENTSLKAENASLINEIRQLQEKYDRDRDSADRFRNPLGSVQQQSLSDLFSRPTTPSVGGTPPTPFLESLPQTSVVALNGLNVSLRGSAGPPLSPDKARPRSPVGPRVAGTSPNGRGGDFLVIKSINNAHPL